MDQQEVSQQPMQDPVMNNVMPEPAKSSKVWMIMAILAIVALIGVTVFGYYKHSQYRTLVGNLGAQINGLQNQVKSLEIQLTAAQAKSPTAATAQTDTQQIISATQNYALATNTAVKSASVTITVIEGSNALVTVTPTPAQTNYSNIFALKKQNGIWLVVYTGTVKPTVAEAAILGLPNTTQFHQ